VCGIVLDAAYIFVRHSILDTTIDAFMGVFVGEILSKIAVSSLVDLLVVAVSLLSVTANARPRLSCRAAFPRSSLHERLW